MGLINPPGLGPVKTGWGRLLTFALDGSVQIPAAPFGYSGPPTPSVEMDASPEMIKEGSFLFSQHCSACHGVNAIAGQLPDLRYATAEVHETIEPIILEGARKPLGMPSFKELLTPEQLRKIQAYVLSQAKAASSDGK